MNPKKTVRLSSFDALRAEWQSRVNFCQAEADKFNRATHGKREWEARAGSVLRCLNELNAIIRPAYNEMRR